MTPNNDEIKRIMGDHAALAANYKNVPPLARGNPGPSAAMGVPQPSQGTNFAQTNSYTSKLIVSKRTSDFNNAILYARVLQ